MLGRGRVGWGKRIIFVMFGFFRFEVVVVIGGRAEGWGSVNVLYIFVVGVEEKSCLFYYYCYWVVYGLWLC